MQKVTFRTLHLFTATDHSNGILHIVALQANPCQEMQDGITDVMALMPKVASQMELLACPFVLVHVPFVL